MNELKNKFEDEATIIPFNGDLTLRDWEYFMNYLNNKVVNYPPTSKGD